VGPSLLLLQQFVGLLNQPWMIGDDDGGAVSRMDECQGKPKYATKTCHSTALSTTDPTLDLPRSRTRASAVGTRRLAD
jgi:hypothetical protein